MRPFFDDAHDNSQESNRSTFFSFHSRFLPFWRFFFYLFPIIFISKQQRLTAQDYSHWEQTEICHFAQLKLMAMMCSNLMRWKHCVQAQTNTWTEYVHQISLDWLHNEMNENESKLRAKPRSEQKNNILCITVASFSYSLIFGLLLFSFFHLLILVSIFVYLFFDFMTISRLIFGNLFVCTMLTNNLLSGKNKSEIERVWMWILLD